MKIRALWLLMLGFSAAAPAWGDICPAPRAATGSVDLTVAGLNLTSVGYAECSDGAGLPCGSYWTLRGGHGIHDQDSGLPIQYVSYSRSGSGYFAVLPAYGSYARCYRAHLTATVSDVFCVRATNAWSSAQGCTESSPCPGGGPAPRGVRPLGIGGCGNSPVLLDLDDHGFELTGPDDPVTFDIDADGSPDRITWTAPDSRVAFLVLDRNGNGLIDNGLELFGNSTVLSTGDTAKFGYDALAEFDRPDMGGNGDGLIGPGDAVWENLRLWEDSNHNGVSEPGELIRLARARIAAIDYHYSLSWKRDRYGNLFRAKSRAWRETRSRRLREIKTYDVFFQRVG